MFLQNDVELCYHLPFQVREDGPHSFIGMGPNRGKFESSDLPPGCTANFGAPKEASPFIQIHLPANMKCHGKKSRSVSFTDTSGASSSGARSIVRDKDAAIRSALAWAWEWYHDLSAAEQDAVKSATSQAAERQSKRRKCD